jgi:hypothetical protein
LRVSKESNLYKVLLKLRELDGRKEMKRGDECVEIGQGDDRMKEE